MRLPLAVLAAAALSACVVPIPIPLGVVAPAGDDTCGAEALGPQLVGRDAGAIGAIVFTAPVRVIRPGDVVTQDFSPGRINFDVDSSDRITGVRCG